MSTMGVDIGTTGCKALVFDERGRECASAYREYPLLAPRPGWAELDSRAVGEACLEVIRQAALRAAPDPVRGLGISSQGEAFTPVGSRGEILGNAMVSSDTRAAPIAETWSAEFGRDRLYGITGHTPHPMFTLFKLLWLRDHEPAVWRQAARFLCFEDFLVRCLGLEPTMGHPLAGRTMLFNVRRHAWDEDILAAVGLDRGRLARSVPAGTVIGRVAPATARDLGLAADAVVVAGGHDQPSGALGAGVVAEGSAMYASGTVECICPAFSALILSPELCAGNLCTYDFALPGMYTTVAFSLTGGNLLKWFRDEWCPEERATAVRTGRNVYDLILEGLSPEPSDVLVLPYFTPSGTPYFDTRTPGAVLGLRLSTRRGEVLRGLMEGVALEMRLNLDILERSGIGVRDLRAIGGGARSRTLTQLKADVINRPISTVAVTEAGCFGMAMWACAALAHADVREVAGQWVRVTSVLTPNPRTADLYQARFEAYQRAYAALKALAAEPLRAPRT